MNIQEAEPKKWLNPNRILILLILLAALIRTAAALTRPMIQLDETAYVRMAENLAGGHGLLDISGVTSTHFSPLFPFFIAGLATIVRDYVFSGYIVVVVFGSLILIPVYLLGKELVSKRVGLMAAALMAFVPLFVDYSSRLYSESVYVFFLLLAILFGRHMLRGCRLPCSILTGMSLGLAYLANPSAVFYFMALVVLAVGVAFVNGVWRQMAKALLIMALVFSVYAVPYVIFLHSQLGAWTLNGKHPGVIYGATKNLRGNTLEWEKEMLVLTDDGKELFVMTIEDDVNPVSYFISHPVEGAKNFARQGNIFYSEELARTIPLWLLPLLGLGLFASGWTRRRATGVGYLVVMLLPALIILLMYAHNRFFMPFVPILMIWVAEGWSRLETWGYETIDLSITGERQKRWRKRVPWLVGLCVLLPVLGFAGVTVQKEGYAVEYKEAGEAIKGFPGDGKNVLSRRFDPAFYSGGDAVILPYADYEAMTHYAREKDVDYLVIGHQEIMDWRPQLQRLLGDGSSHPEWELVDTLHPGTDRELLIFKLADKQGES